MTRVGHSRVFARPISGLIYFLMYQTRADDPLITINVMGNCLFFLAHAKMLFMARNWGNWLLLTAVICLFA